MYQFRYIWQKQYRGDKAGNWKGGRHKNGRYIEIYYPSHPFANGGRYVLEHRLVMEKHLGRFLQPDEIVHHLNGKGTDNRLSNLKLCSRSEHIEMHRHELK